MSINNFIGIKNEVIRNLEIPKELNGYIIIKKIIEQYSSVVLLAEEIGKELVAIKFVPYQNYQKDKEGYDIKEKVKGENCSNIIKINKFFLYPTEKPKFAAFIMPFMPTDLLEYLNSVGPIQEKRVKIIMKQLFDTVHKLHSQNILHCNLKLENILLDTQSFSIKLTGFRLAKSIQNEAICAQGNGTLDYSAPELLFISDDFLRFKDEAIYTKKADVWSLGIIMYSLLCGKLPFDIRMLKGAQSLLDGDVNFKPSKNPNDPLKVFNAMSDAKDLIHKLLRADPEKRITTEEANGHKWFADLIEANATKQSSQ